MGLSRMLQLASVASKVQDDRVLAGTVQASDGRGLFGKWKRLMIGNTDKYIGVWMQIHEWLLKIKIYVSSLWRAGGCT